MSRCLILVNDALVDHAVDNRNGVFIRSHSCILVAGVTGLNDVLDLSAHARAQAHVVLASLFRLLGALSR